MIEVATLNELAQRLHGAVRDSKGGAGNVGLLLQRIQDTDARVTPLEEDFSSSLGQISRQLRVISIPGIAIVAAFAGCSLELR